MNEKVENSPSTMSPTEPAIPNTVDQHYRRQTQVTPPTVDVSALPDHYLVCGCGDCGEVFDPLADASHEDGILADTEFTRSDAKIINSCDAPAPPSIEKAAKIYRVYQTASYRRDDHTSSLERAKVQHAAVMDSERDIRRRWDGETSMALLSLRPKPTVEVPKGGTTNSDNSVNYEVNPTNRTLSQGDTSCSGGSTVADGHVRLWIPPTQLADSIMDAWPPVRRQLDRHLDRFESSEYLRVLTTTDETATPHLHVVVWVRDAANELDAFDVEPAVRSFVRNCPQAQARNHTVARGESDAAVVETDPTEMGIDEDQLLHIFRAREKEPYSENTAFLGYVMNQRDVWAIRRICDHGAEPKDEQSALEGAAIERASTRNWIGCSNRISLSPTQ